MAKKRDTNSMSDSTPPSNDVLSPGNLELDLQTALDTALEESNPSTIDIQQFFSFLKLQGSSNNVYAGLTIDQETALSIKNHLISMKHGTYAAVPLICGGPHKCPIVHRCWFAKRLSDGTIDHANSTFPVLRPCPVETSILQIKVKQYVQEFIDQYMQGGSNIDSDSTYLTPTTMSLITKLAELDIYEIRCDLILSSGDRHGQGMDLLVQTVEAINEATGDVIYGVKEHPILAIKERLQKSRDKILSQLIATPEAKMLAKAKIKASSGESGDIASQLTALNRKMKEIQSQHGIIDMSDTHSYQGNPGDDE